MAAGGRKGGSNLTEDVGLKRACSATVDVRMDRHIEESCYMGSVALVRRVEGNYRQLACCWLEGDTPRPGTRHEATMLEDDGRHDDKDWEEEYVKEDRVGLAGLPQANKGRF